MRIFIVVEEFDPEKSYLEYYLAKELVVAGNNVTVFTFSSSNTISKNSFKEGFDVIILPSLIMIQKYHIPTLNGLKYILKFAKKNQPDIIHCQPLDSPLSLFLVSCKKFLHYKIVGSIMTQLNLVYSNWGFKKRLLFLLSKIILKQYVIPKSEAIFAKTIKLAELLSRSYDIVLNKFHIIPLGSSPDVFKYDSSERGKSRRMLNFSQNDTVLIYSGKIDKTKGLDLLIEALAPICSNNKKVKLLIVGKGETTYIDYLKGLIIKNNLENVVVLHPWVEKVMLPSLYSASDIGVWPGLSSISIVDAASSGLPLIISSCPVETYAIDNGNGFSFQFGDLLKLRNYLELLINNEPLRKLMGNRSRILVEKKLNWKCVTEKYLKVYSSTLQDCKHNESKK